jgi:formylglycine-generating enzyme required for sulfatase activity
MESSKNNQGLTPFRIFLASPGDVPLERKLAREAITHINSERRFRGRIDIEIIAWDQPGAAVAMEAGLTPQEAIAQGLHKPEDCDLAVIVFWSRIGTQLSADFEKKEDGSPYLSGTEWEYLNALKGYRTNRKPSVWIYRRKGAPSVDLNDPQLEEKRDQLLKLETFFTAFKNTDGSLAGGINYYQAPDDFRQQFEHHLRDRLDKLLETLPQAVATQPDKQATLPPRWSGSPYPGLQAFSPEQAPIFFGRGAEIDQLIQQLSDPHVQFVAVVGVSGSGKSSLVKAGLLPRLRTGIVGNSPWMDLAIKPGERGGNPFVALAYALKPVLDMAGQTEDEIARSMQADHQVAQNHLTQLLQQHNQATELLLLIDQFEELFTQTKAEDRRDFVELIKTIVAAPHLRVAVTLRADFFARAIEDPVLACLLRRDRGTFPLDPPGISAIHEMITRPAEAAGVELEEGLAQRLLDDAGEGPGAMALIAFTLHQLYDQEKDSGFLSIAAYQAFGGVQGAVQQRAESALQGLRVDLDTTLPTLFANLVEVNEQEVATRRRAPQSRLAGEVMTAANALTEARLLVSGKGENDQAVLEVAHEIVLDGWERLRQWIREHTDALRARRDLERVATEWEKSGHHRSALRGGKLLLHYLNAAEPRSNVADDYLSACKRARSVQRIGYAVVGLLAILVLGVLLHVNKSDYPPTLAAKALFVQIGLWPVSMPKMETIPAGEFEMGDLSESKEGQRDELPVRTVRFENPFEMGKYEVTFEEYDLFAAATGRDKPSDQGWGRESYPVINVSWKDAVAYTKWLSKRTGLKFRLPSEAEWEYAARATTKTSRYWDNPEGEQDVACQYANVFDTKNDSKIRNTYGGITWDPFHCEDEYAFNAPVGQFKANDWKLHDMLGNVWEWTQDCYVDTYEGAPENGRARENTGEGDCDLRVLRGGSWGNDPLGVRSSRRFRYTPGNRNSGIGFRLARTL